MVVCESCHRKICSGSHVMVSFGPCELCRLEAECFDCIASHPVTAEEIRKDEERRTSTRVAVVRMYRHTGLLKYPRDKK